MPRKILVTSALPYANGPLHLGHIIEVVQTDIWVRFQRMQGNDCLYVCAEDTHGTPVMIKAQAEGITPEELIRRVAAEHVADYQGFLIGHDHFHSTHSAENQAITGDLYRKLRAAGHITTRSVRQAFDEPQGSANFDPISPRTADDYLAVSDVLQSTFIAVDENGTEAAASTALELVSFSASAGPRPKPIEMHVNRPFLFAIQHQSTGACLFLGRVVDPQEK